MVLRSEPKEDEEQDNEVYKGQEEGEDGAHDEQYEKEVATKTLEIVDVTRRGHQILLLLADQHDWPLGKVYTVLIVVHRRQFSILINCLLYTFTTPTDRK